MGGGGGNRVAVVSRGAGTGGSGCAAHWGAGDGTGCAVGMGARGTETGPSGRVAPGSGSAAARAAQSKKLRQDGKAADRQYDSWYVSARGCGDDSA